MLVGVDLAAARHFAHYATTGRLLSPVEPSQATAVSNSGTERGDLFFVVAMLSTLLLGRSFCGWAGHLVALQDLCGG